MLYSACGVLAQSRIYSIFQISERDILIVATGRAVMAKLNASIAHSTDAQLVAARR